MKSRKGYPIGMQLKFDVSCHLPNVYIKFQIDIPKYIAKRKYWFPFPMFVHQMAKKTVHSLWCSVGWIDPVLKCLYWG